MRTVDPELHARRRAQILEAAAQCFVTRGFHAASMQDIASEAGVSMGSLYRYFTNKEAIITSFAEVERDQTLAQIERWTVSIHPIEDLPALIRASIREASQPNDGRMAAEVFSEALRNDALRKVLVEHEARIGRALAAAIEVHQRAGRMARSVDPVAVTGIILCLVDGVSTRMLMKSKLPPKAIESAAVDMLTAVLRPVARAKGD